MFKINCVCSRIDVTTPLNTKYSLNYLLRPLNSAGLVLGVQGKRSKNNKFQIYTFQ